METQAQPIRFPFQPGEKLTFNVKWAFIQAGTAVLEVYPYEMIDGSKTWHFVMTAKTTPFVDLIYRIRDRIDAYTNADVTSSVLYREQKDGKRKKRVVIHFDRRKNRAQYSNFGEKMAPIDILPETLDPLSVFYSFRLHELKDVHELKRSVSDGKKCIIGKAKIVGRERITVSSGVYDTFLAEPDLKDIGGVFAKSKNAKLKIWVTADEKRMPVRIESEVRVGSFVAELVSFETGGDQ